MRPGLIAVVLAVLGGGTALAFWALDGRQPMDAAPPAAVPVTIATATRVDMPLEFRALGQVRALRSLEVRPQVEGRLLELPVSEGARVRPGALLARLDDRAARATVRQATAAHDETRAELAIARLDLRRYQNLVADRAAPRQQLDQQQALVGRLEATLAVREASLEAAQVELSHTRIAAPLAGRVGLRNVHEGSLVRPGDALPLFTVVQTDPIAVEAAVPQARLAEVQGMLAQPVAGQVRVYREEGGEPVAEGRLTLFDNRVTSASGTVRVRAEFANADEHLWPDQAVVVALRTGQLDGAVTVPAAAVRQGEGGQLVWVVEDGKAVPRRVRRLAEQDGRVALEGVAAGAQVVVDGQSRLREGVPVTARAPTGTP